MATERQDSQLSRLKTKLSTLRSELVLNTPKGETGWKGERRNHARNRSMMTFITPVRENGPIKPRHERVSSQVCSNMEVSAEKENNPVPLKAIEIIRAHLEQKREDLYAREKMISGWEKDEDMSDRRERLD